MSALAKAAAKDDSDTEDEVVEQTPEVEVAAEPEEITTLENSDVTTKYQEAAKIANLVLQEVIALVCIDA